MPTATFKQARVQPCNFLSQFFAAGRMWRILLMQSIMFAQQDIGIATRRFISPFLWLTKACRRGQQVALAFSAGARRTIAPL